MLPLTFCALAVTVRGQGAPAPLERPGARQTTNRRWPCKTTVPA